MKSSTQHEEFLQLLEPVYPRLSRYSLAITRNVEEAKDLTSETVLTMLEQFESLRTTENFGGYLFKIASRLHKRKRYRERFRISYDRQTAEMQEDLTPSPEQAAEIALVMRALEKLPPKMKDTLVLFEVVDLSLEEIRDIQGGSLSGVKSRLKRGREMVQQNLGIKNTMRINIIGRRPENFNPALKKAEDYYAL